MNNQEKLVEFIIKIGVETFVTYLNMIFCEDSGSSMREDYENCLESTEDMNLAIIECIEDDFSYM